MQGSCNMLSQLYAGFCRSLNEVLFEDMQTRGGERLCSNVAAQHPNRERMAWRL